MPRDILPEDVDTLGRLLEFLIALSAEPGDALKVDSWNRIMTDVGIPELTCTNLDEITGSLSYIAKFFIEMEERCKGDLLFENFGNRWKKDPNRVAGYIPSDAGSLRLSLMLQIRSGLDAVAADPLLAAVAPGYLLPHVAAAAMAYSATPHFIPSRISSDVVTALPPDKNGRDNLRLPGQYVMVFHDGILLSALADDDPHEVFTDFINRDFVVTTKDPLIIGGLLMAGGGDDFSVCTDLAYLIIAGRDEPNDPYMLSAVPVSYSDKGAGRVLYNYASLLSWENWAAPPKLPGVERGITNSRSQQRKIGRSPQAQAGGWHGVRVLDYQPPSAEPSDGQSVRGRGTGKPLQHQHPRRAHWRNNVRFGIRDKNGNPVGPVYGPDAVEGKTFTRVRRFVPKKVVREDLPPREDLAPQPVYRLPSDARPTSARSEAALATQIMARPPGQLLRQGPPSRHSPLPAPPPGAAPGPELG